MLSGFFQRFFSGCSTSANHAQNNKLDTHWNIGLPKDVMQNTLFGYHTLEEAETFAQASTQTAGDYKPLIDTARILPQFLDHIVKGNQDDAEKILKTNPKLSMRLLGSKGDVTDFSGRTFRNITGFQYTLWALDRHMWQMLLKYMDLQNAAKQLQELEQDGVTYELSKIADQKPEIKQGEVHYNFDELITAYMNYINFIVSIINHRNVSGSNKYEHTNKISYAQRFIPVHVANEYCRPDRNFVPLPKFDEKSLPRTLSLMIKGVQYYYPCGPWFPLLPSPDLCERDSILVRGLFADGAVYQQISRKRCLTLENAHIDLQAITSLKNRRMQEYQQLKGYLLTQVLKAPNPTKPKCA